MRPARVPNQALRCLLAEAGWSGARLAREINRAATENGLETHYDRTAVGHWLAGTRPRRPAAELAAEVLSRHLGRTVTPGETDLVAAAAEGRPAAAPWREDAVEHLERLGAFRERCDLTLLGAYSLAALTVPNWSTRTTLALGTAQPRQRSAAHDIDDARTMLALFSRHDASFGGGQVRRALSGYLATTLAPWLRRDTSPRLRRDLVTVAGQLAYLCAFAHFDSNLHNQAQQYYLVGLSLAQHAGDRVGYALGLRGLSVQAHALGHIRHADRLAAQAVSVGTPHAPDHQRAFLLGQLAVTQAGLGAADAAGRYLVLAEKSLEKARTGDTPIGAFNQASLALQRAAVATELGDRHRAAQALAISLRHRPPTESRSRLISLADLAEAQLGLGHLDRACLTWSAFLDLYPTVSSARLHQRLRSLHALLRPHRAYRPAMLLTERAEHVRRKIAAELTELAALRARSAPPPGYA
ncbi:hypothetical protein ACFXKR_36180 [Streptomyces violascens]|uniref:hypothetical protein n=1 Tax=Streptomyces violascens TaxID=67381 RepID=UPI0036BED8BA